MGKPSCGTEVDTNAIPISQQPPFRYVDALLSLDRDARQAELRLSFAEASIDGAVRGPSQVSY